MVSRSIRRFDRDDIPSAIALCRAAGWNQLPEDWSRLIEEEPDGCFVAEADGEIVGTVTSTRYGSTLAWIGMMLVDERFRQRGIATQLMSTCLEYLRKQRVRCIKLDATPAGQSMYERLGFRAEWSFHRWAREAVNPNDAPSRRASDSTLGQSHLDLDRIAFGADRSGWLERLGQQSNCRQNPSGFGMLRRGYLADYLGPVVAKDRDAANEIIDDLLSQSSSTLFWDIPQVNRDAVEIAKSHRFEPVRQLTRMWTGREIVTPAMHLQYALSDPGTG